MLNNSQLYLWNDRTLYIGAVPHRTTLCLGGSSFLVFLDASARLKFANHSLTAQTFLVPAARSVEIDRHAGRVAVLALDSLGYEYHTLLETMRQSIDGVAWHSMTEKAVVQTFKTIARGNYGAKDIYYWMRSLTRPEEYFEKLDYRHDPRIEKAMTLIKLYGDTPMDIEDCAQQVGLSTDELQALFEARVGLSIASFRAWRLLGDTVTYMAEGLSTEQAAIKAGFESEDQYFRVFVRHFGLHPRALAKYSQGVDIHVYKKPISSEEPKESLYSAPDFFVFG